MKISKFTLIACLTLVCLAANAQLQNHGLVNEPLDIAPDFYSFKNTYYFADSIVAFDAASAKGKIAYNRYEYKTRYAFNNMLGVLKPVSENEFPEGEYEAAPQQTFCIEFISDKTVRLRFYSGADFVADESSLMLVDGKVKAGKTWKYSTEERCHIYTSEYGKVVISEFPWRIAFYDAKGKLLTSTNHHLDNAETTYTPIMPFSYVRRASDYSRSFNAAFSLSPNEMIFGCGESYTSFNKRGQKVVLCADDGNGTQNETLYKPIPFFMSNRGYGMFMHTSSPITCDFGKYFNGINSLMVGDETLDLFVFLGEPKTILDEYTTLTGKAQMPPLWSFGFWMSRITYFSEEDGRRVAKELRDNEIPCDVIHFDTGWFETDWRCDYQFSESRFDDAGKMIKDLKKQGFETCLWQLPYFVPKNELFNEIIDKQLFVKNSKGNLPYEDAVLDFSNPATVEWYQDKIAGLLKLGVGAIKVDFGEAAPYNGIYASGKTGFYEHNLYPLRYNKAVADITQQVKGEQIMWARSTWAGSQRYPIHWGGDPANTNTAMAASLRGGLSIGLSGFSFWSHDIGGFVLKSPEELYRRWTPFGMLTSHTRSHGAPPKEPWEYSEKFLNDFRKAANMRYQLMPYIYAQAKKCSETGLPMLRALFVEYPDDAGAWLVDDQYLFGDDLLVAPLMENVSERNVYLPKGKWIDYQTGKKYEGGWHKIAAGDIPVVMLVRSGAAIPHIKLAQSTKDMKWDELELRVFSDSNKASGLIYLPGSTKVNELKLNKVNEQWQVANAPSKVKLLIK
ncbi:alpha-xylosidase [Carboxylicivirga sp. A043]|uniref:glycoside hydrolase family 31 protein n=1 Tax=Carboxylicivirga litoralis TaxID=2816963 RepID=UPI0021CAEA2B|nr:TIM-barrel domain-containing protein [Carboxylicivirga sp. A043]MCU4155631.1 alpha-xylosidase [Carboxylicivirga sp. A043]